MSAVPLYAGHNGVSSTDHERWNTKWIQPHANLFGNREKKEKDNWMSKREELTDKDTLEINY